MRRPYYFSPGPASLPHEVMTRFHERLINTFDNGVSILEISHRSELYAKLNDQLLSLARHVFQVPQTHEIIFTPFGAQQHFCLLVDHLSQKNDTVAYMETGNWAAAAVNEARLMGRNVHLSFSDAPHFYGLGQTAQWDIPHKARYLHITVNNTVEGTEYLKIPDHLKLPLVLDMTSSLGARTDIPWQNTALIYASAQKNFGIAGASIVIINKETLAESRNFVKQNELGLALSYPAFLDAKSIFNTPPVVALFVASLTLEWIKEQGGTPAMEARAKQKAHEIYSQIDGEFYQGRPRVEDRSRHNFVFKLPTPKLDELFIEEAGKQGILEIRGYKTTGGIRISMYNGAPMEGAKATAQFMAHFKKTYG